MSEKSATVTAGPFVKWVGGKSQLLAQLAPLFPTERVQRYFEPFVGSGAVFFHLQERNFADRYNLSDVNDELVNVYCAVRDNTNALITQLEAHHTAHHVDENAHFYAVRAWDREDEWPDNRTPVERAARMIYLNKTCYNGLWRVNSKNQFNTPLGRYTNPGIVNAQKLQATAAALANVDISVRDYRAVLDLAQAGDFVYFDPPYIPLSKTANFTGYTKDSFGPQQQQELADLCRALDRKGCRFMLSNSSAPEVYALYEGFDLRIVQARRPINTKANKRGRIDEVVVLNYEPPNTD